MREFGFRAWLLRAPVPPRTRGRMLRLFGATVGSNVRVHPLTVMDAGWANLSIADDVYVGHDCILDLTAPLTIGRGAVLSAGVSVVTHQNAGTAHGSPVAERIGTWAKPVRIGPYAFMGTRAVVMADVGPYAVVGAGAVVTRMVPEDAKVVGVPARGS